MKPNRLLLLLAVLLECSVAARADLASIFTNTTPTVSAIPRRTSIIFIQCHGLAPGDLSCYGQANFQTPNLDRLAAGGIRFSHYSGGLESAETTALLLAGKNSGLLPGEPNLAQRLKLSGYRTGLIGEWGLPGTPWTQGFDEFAGFLQDAEGQNYYADYLWRYAPKAIYNEKAGRWDAFEGREALHPNSGGLRGQFLPDLLINAMANFVRVNEPDFANQYRPFFLLVNLPAPRTATTGADDFPVPSDAPFTGEPWPQAAKNRAALISRLDSGVGRLFEQLKKSNLTNNVAIFFTSSSAPEKFANTNLNFLLPKESFRSTNNPVPPTLPMIVYWPGTIPPDRTSQQPWTIVDIAPTALAIAYEKPVTNFTGKSVLPTLLGRPAKKVAPSKP